MQSLSPYPPFIIERDSPKDALSDLDGHGSSNSDEHLAGNLTELYVRIGVEAP